VYIISKRERDVPSNSQPGMMIKSSMQKECQK
jgi:hypothetical protein